MYAQSDCPELLDFGPDATFSKHNGLEELEHNESFCSLPEEKSSPGIYSGALSLSHKDPCNKANIALVLCPTTAGMNTLFSLDWCWLPFLVRWMLDCNGEKPLSNPLLTGISREDKQVLIVWVSTLLLIALQYYSLAVQHILMKNTGNIDIMWLLSL